jgi:GxxExxY protein
MAMQPVHASAASPGLQAWQLLPYAPGRLLTQSPPSRHRGPQSKQMEEDPQTKRVIGCAIEVHRTLGPGLLESAYEQCMAHELTLQGVEFRLQVPMPVQYKGLRLDCAFKADVVVYDSIIVELKSVETLTALHEAQVLTYMRMARARTGLLINFNVKRLVEGIRRFRR